MQHVLQGATQLPAHLRQAPSLDAPTAPIAFAPPPPNVQSPPPSTSKAITPQPGPTAPAGSPQGAVAIPSAPPVARRASKTNVGLLVGVAVGFLLLGVGLALAISKLIAH